jgi:hypothetical protein
MNQKRLLWFFIALGSIKRVLFAVADRRSEERGIRGMLRNLVFLGFFVFCDFIQAHIYKIDR